MSNTVRIAAAVEGQTDAIVLEAVLNALMTNTEFEFQTLQPEESVAFGSSSSRTGTGWGGGLSLVPSISGRRRRFGFRLVGAVQS